MNIFIEPLCFQKHQTAILRENRGGDEILKLILSAWAGILCPLQTNCLTFSTYTVSLEAFLNFSPPFQKIKP